MDVWELYRKTSVSYFKHKNLVTLPHTIMRLPHTKSGTPQLAVKPPEHNHVLRRTEQRSRSQG